MPSTPSQLDLAVIGGGPAGSASAIMAARAGAKVGLFEARDFPRHKVCGEFVSAESLDLLAGLLCNVPGASSVFDKAPILDTTHLHFRGRTINVKLSPPALSLTRYELDALLWEAARHTGVELHPNCEVTNCEHEDSFTLQARFDRYSARAVIVASGRWSQFTADRTLPSGPKWIGLKAHFRECQAKLSTDLYFFEQGYCGVQPVARDVVNVCAMVRSDGATTLREVFALDPLLAGRAAAWQPETPQVSTAPLIYREPQPTRDNMIFVGDAAAFIDPFAGDGISIALRSGQVAAECLHDFLVQKCPLVDSVETYRRRYYAQFAPLISVAAAVRSLFSLPEIVKPAVFELLRLPGLVPYMMRKTRRSS